jgi:YHS domain-containing protein
MPTLASRFGPWSEEHTPLFLNEVIGEVMKLALFLIVLVFGFLVATGSATAQASAGSTSSTVVNTMCPVMGNPVDTAVTTEWQGKTYAFCCPSCIKRFTKNPERWTAQSDKMEAKSDSKQEPTDAAKRDAAAGHTDPKDATHHHKHMRMKHMTKPNSD